ncbi:glycosyltransferase [Larkinella rosea]|uniref:Glycosyltransferase n=1 Tax=Larkinella rosea TaxID=2025312 RepID=A0A3P1BIM6_9BACT|nr:glycosyltransferase [Larkinella rosea]RRB00888.1 glycosyltransferase [Larkinella rosea]
MNQKRQRILHISTAHPPYDPRIMYKYLPVLADEYDVYCAIPNADPNVSPKVHFIKLPYYKHVILRFFITCPLIVWKTVRLRPDLIHIYSAEFLPYAYIYRMLGAAVIYEVQENLYKKIHLKRHNRGWLLKRAFQFFDQKARRDFSLIFTEHGYLTTYTDLAKPYAIIYNYPLLPFLDSFRRTYRRASDPIDFFYIGWLSFERSIVTLLEGMALLKSTHPNFKVHLFGHCSFTSQDLEALPAYQLVKDNLIFYGYTDQAKAFAKAAKSVAGLALLKPVGDYPESYTTKMFEYMVLGLPVITSNFPLYRAVVEENRCGFCIDPTDPVALVESLRFLIDHPTEAEQMGKRGRKAAETTYNWSSEQPKLLNLYKLSLSPNNYELDPVR